MVALQIRRCSRMSDVGHWCRLPIEREATRCGLLEPGVLPLPQVPVPEVDAYRDAVSVPTSLDFTEILDLLSAEGLECVGQRLHRGWEDRRFSCQRARDTAQEAVGLTLASEERDPLLLLSAYRNRIFRYPPPLRIVPGEITAGFEALGTSPKRHRVGRKRSMTSPPVSIDS